MGLGVIHAAVVVVAGLGALLAAHSAASAASFKTTISKENKTIISLDGEISEGDTDALKAAVKRDPNDQVGA